MIIETWRDPYDAGFTPTKPKEIELHPGLTVLVGCNGAGKTTLIRNIQEQCKVKDVPYLYYDNLHNGGSNAMSEMFYHGDMTGGSILFSSSEGESIKYNIGRKSMTYSEFIQNGYIRDRVYNLSRALRGDDPNTIDIIECDDRVFLFDAVDSGLSVDSVVELRDMLDCMIKDSEKYQKNIYIIIAANEYELARNSNCFDVNRGEYIQFKDYEAYRSFILQSRKNKEKRIDQQERWVARKKASELRKYHEVVSRQKKLLEKFEATHDMDHLVGSERYRLEDIQRMVKDFVRNARFLTESDLEREGESL